jgi:RNA polymerase sigma-32 factor
MRPLHMSAGTANASLKISSDGNLSRYLREVHGFPILSAEEELELGRRWRDGHDLGAAHRLVASHLRLVAKIAMGYRGYGLPICELIGEGNVGMMKAVQRFDPDRGCRLATYALWWIRSSIQEYVLHSWSLVKMGTTAAQKRLFFNLRRLKNGMQVVQDSELTAQQVMYIAVTLDVPEQDVINMNRRLSGPDHSLNAPIRSEDDTERQDWLVGETPSQETDLANREELAGGRALLPKALGILDKRERHILSERRLKDEPATLKALSQHYGISPERVRQIEGRAFAKLQKEMRTQVHVRRAAAA